jgi:hypothetical protein
MTENRGRLTIGMALVMLAASADVARDGVTNAGKGDPATVNDLALLGNTIDTLLTTRNVVLERLREQHTPWKAISAGTGIPASTWRNRHQVAIGGAVTP